MKFDICVFQTKENIRYIVDSNYTPWFSLKDVCDLLELSNVTNAAKRLDEDEVAVFNIDSGNGNQDYKMINESGLYHLILTANPKKGKGKGSVTDAESQRKQDKVDRFRKWITSEILPSIRATGEYKDKENKFQQLCPVDVRATFRNTMGRLINQAGGYKYAKNVWFNWYMLFEKERDISFFFEAKKMGIKPIDWLKAHDLVDDFYNFVVNNA